MKIEIWSDVVCPWCYIGKRRIESALKDLDEPVELIWRSFELDPSAPKQLDGPLIQMLAKKYGMSLAQAKQAQQRVTDTAKLDGLSFELDRAQTGNTFDAHRLIHLAQTQGLGDAMKERLMQAYFCEGVLPSDHTQLKRLADEVGLKADAVAQTLSTDAFATDVRADQAQAAELGIRGVPFFVFDGKFGVSGAQPAEVLRQVIERAQSEAIPAAPGCEDDHCELP